MRSGSPKFILQEKMASAGVSGSASATCSATFGGANQAARAERITDTLRLRMRGGRSRASKAGSGPQSGGLKAWRACIMTARQHEGGDEFVLGDAGIDAQRLGGLCGSISSCPLPPGE